MNTSGADGVFGDYADIGGLVGNQDTYNPGSAIIPKLLGVYSRRGKIKSKRRRKRKR